MEFFINEQQLKLILQEQNKSKMSDYMKDLYSFTYDLVNKVKTTYGLNVRMLLTWGASVAGILRPLDVWLKSGEFKLSESERILILAGIGMILFFESKSVLTKIVNKIKELKLEDVFEFSLRQGSELKSVFIDFISSLNTSVGAFMDIVAYSFLIPILTDIQQAATRATNIKEAAISIAERLLASGVVVVSSNALVAIIKKILKRFKG